VYSWRSITVALIATSLAMISPLRAQTGRSKVSGQTPAEMQQSAATYTALRKLGYRPDYQGPSAGADGPKSLEIDRTWEGGLRLMAAPTRPRSSSLVVHDRPCPDSLLATNSACEAFDAILVCFVADSGAEHLRVLLVARSIVGTRDGPIRPWPTSAQVRQDAERVAKAVKGRVVVAEDLPPPEN
jgi:hypothetical protein